MTEEGRYVYCIIECGERINFGKIGIGDRGDEVYTIPYKDISAVVSDTPLVEYEPSEENALTHMNVIQRVMQDYTVLPLKFSTIFKSEMNLKKILMMHYNEFKAELERLRDKIEFGVKVLWQPEVAIDEVRRTSEKVKSLEREMKGKALRMKQNLKEKLDEAIKDELNRRAEEYSEAIFEELKKHASESRKSRMVGHMILNGAFLLHKSSIDEFKIALERIKSRYEPKGLEFIFSGPWPPYNFVKIRYE
ncbi:MAG: GvpL/GvpF family gas vesicle protein [archaeon]|nr:GvpL/GvpF family gas vesicle protein [archaeon]